MIKDCYYYKACEYAKDDYFMFGIKRTQKEVEREAERLRKQALLKGRERPREDLPHWINQAALELYEACEEFVRKCEYAENFVAKVEKALDRAAKYVSEVVEGCPIALELGYEICKEDGCDNDAAVCWMKYFLSEEARRGGEGVQK